MSKQRRARPAGTKASAASRGGARPGTGGAGWRPGKSSGAMKASMFARMRVNIDAVAFATPSGTLSKARLFVETVEAFEKKKRQPRNLVLILSRGLDAEVFEVFEAPFARVSPLLARAPMSAGERAYWTLDFHKATQRLSDGQGAEVELKKLEKRRER